MRQEQVYTPTDFVTVLNQTLEYAYPSVLVQGELADFRVSKGRWLYFKLRDEHASVHFFGTVSQVQHELREGMMIQVRGFPRLHPLYNFSIQVQFMQPVGEGSIKKAADLLMEKLKKEGLFDPARKRPIKLPPRRLGLITSGESAAYHDFVKVLGQRWGGLSIDLYDVQVQGEPAAEQIVRAMKYFNAQKEVPDVLVLTRGGGSPEDLAAFSTESVTRAVAGSTIPTVVAVGHETDVSLAELAADLRASTPSNAAELLVPDRRDAKQQLAVDAERAGKYLHSALVAQQNYVQDAKRQISDAVSRFITDQRSRLEYARQLLGVLHPHNALDRGYAIVQTRDGQVVRSGQQLKSGQHVSLQLRDATAESLIQSVKVRKRNEQ